MRLIPFGCLTLMCVSPVFAADIFDRHTLAECQQAIQQGTAAPQLTLKEAAKLKPLAANLSSPCIVVRTDEGHFAKVLLGWGLRKSADQSTPVVLLERFVTFRADRPGLTTAAGKDVMLFPGFGFNFDIGQVVPAGHGADLELTPDGTVKPVGAAVLVPMSGSLLANADPLLKHDPQAHDGVLIDDFAGRWKFDADGRWQGEWELKLGDNGRLIGTFVSAESQNRYEVLGQTTATPHQVRLEIVLANTQMQVDAYLWTKDKSQMAGTVMLSGRKFGFHAVRLAE